MRLVRGSFDSLPFDEGGRLPLPPVEFGKRALEVLRENKVPIALFLAGLVLAA